MTHGIRFAMKISLGNLGFAQAEEPIARLGRSGIGEGM